MLDWMYLVRSDGPVVPGPPSSCPYSPECVEEEFSEVRMQDPALPRPDRPRIAAVGTPDSGPFLMFVIAPWCAVCT
jgi:hypothetical protein